MAYITISDYASLTGDTDTPTNFDQLCALAESVIDAHTLYGYVGRDIAALPAYIAAALKQAVAYQMQYIIQLGGVAGANDASDYNSVSLGSYSYSRSASGRSAGAAQSHEITLSKAAAVNIPLLIAYARGLRL